MKYIFLMTAFLSKAVYVSAFAGTGGIMTIILS
jgi:hypothetical protein